mgnify:CR=1 FL=1
MAAICQGAHEVLTDFWFSGGREARCRVAGRCMHGAVLLLLVMCTAAHGSDKAVSRVVSTDVNLLPLTSDAVAASVGWPWTSGVYCAVFASRVLQAMPCDKATAMRASVVSLDPTHLQRALHRVFFGQTVLTAHCRGSQDSSDRWFCLFPRLCQPSAARSHMSQVTSHAASAADQLLLQPSWSCSSVDAGDVLRST